MQKLTLVTKLKIHRRLKYSTWCDTHGLIYEPGAPIEVITILNLNEEGELEVRVARPGHEDPYDTKMIGSIVGSVGDVKTVAESVLMQCELVSC